VKYLALFLLGSFCSFAATPGVVVHSAKNLDSLSQQLAAKKSRFASQNLERYPKHYTMLAERNSNGSAELHEHEADIYFVISGNATLVSGGKMVNPHTEKPGEVRAPSIQGGERQQVGKGDVVHISANIPHQLLIPEGQEFSYFVVKVTDQ
jgi:mannose-6-phosphate isomerase-like protein (cupin superfamily)